MYSKLSEKCKKCPHVNNCNNKRMEACAVMEVIREPNLRPNITVPLAMPITAPVLRDTSIQAQIAEQIAEQLKKDFYKHYNFCAFEKL
jgi:hypothetical protein